MRGEVGGNDIALLGRRGRERSGRKSVRLGDGTDGSIEGNGFGDDGVATVGAVSHRGRARGNGVDPGGVDGGSGQLGGGDGSIGGRDREMLRLGRGGGVSPGGGGRHDTGAGAGAGAGAGSIGVRLLRCRRRFGGWFLRVGGCGGRDGRSSGGGGSRRRRRGRILVGAIRLCWLLQRGGRGLGRRRRVRILVGAVCFRWLLQSSRRGGRGLDGFLSRHGGSSGVSCRVSDARASRAGGRDVAVLEVAGNGGGGRVDAAQPGGTERLGLLLEPILGQGSVAVVGIAVRISPCRSRGGVHAEDDDDTLHRRSCCDACRAACWRSQCCCVGVLNKSQKEEEKQKSYNNPGAPPCTVTRDNVSDKNDGRILNKTR